MDGLKDKVILEMRGGYRPTYRGHEWAGDHFAALEGAADAIEVAWHLLKYLQFPEMESRLDDAQAASRQLLGRRFIA